MRPAFSRFAQSIWNGSPRAALLAPVRITLT
jgi:hypothetical protein